VWEVEKHWIEVLFASWKDVSRERDHLALLYGSDVALVHCGERSWDQRISMVLLAALLEE
jgi:hypothetical protein